MKSAAKMARKTAAPHANSQAGRLLIVGTGDIAQRALPQLVRKFTVFAMTRSEAGVKTLSGMGVTPVLADLDRPDSLRQLPVTDVVLHSAPPQLKGARDDRTRNLVNALEHAQIVTTGGTLSLRNTCSAIAATSSRPKSPTRGVMPSIVTVTSDQTTVISSACATRLPSAS